MNSKPQVMGKLGHAYKLTFAVSVAVNLLNIKVTIVRQTIKRNPLYALYFSPLVFGQRITVTSGIIHTFSVCLFWVEFYSLFYYLNRTR